MMRRLNLGFLAVLLAVVAVFGGGMHLAHGIQVRRNASALLDRASRAEAGDDLEKAEQSLGQYLSLRREDGPAWKRYAQLLDQRDHDRQRRERVFLVHEEALRYNPGDSQLERRCADLALELRRYGDAQRRLTNLLENVSKDSPGQPAAAELAELEDMLGQCDFGLTQYDMAEKRFLRALQHDPERVSCYERLALMRRNQLRRIGDADRTIKEMVAKNPKAARAYLYRWRYAREFLPSADANDLQLALGLAPEDPEVLFVAAVASEQKQASAAAKAYYQKGCKLHPKNSAFALGLARLEMREGHLDHAEAVLRQAYQANPSFNLAFVLAENLILQDKIDGPDQAVDYIDHLRSAGFGETFVRFLEAEILFQRKQWTEAVPRLEMSRAVLKAVPQLTLQVNLMLAECYGRVGSDEKRLDALRQAASGDRTSDFARADFALASARSGKLDQAISTLSSLTSSKPELRLDLVRLLIQKAIRQPGDRQSWQEVDRYLSEAEKALPQSVESVTLLRADMLAARDRLSDARSLLSSAQTKDPRNLRYRLALARLTQVEGKSSLAVQILSQAEKDLGPSLEIQLARLDFWGREGGDEAKAAVAKLAEARQRMPAADQPLFLDRLSSVEARLGDLAIAKDHLRELAKLQPANVQVLMGLFDLATQTADRAGALDIVVKMRELEGDRGTLWRFGQASCLIDEARRGETEDLKVPSSLAAEIAVQRPDWWGSSVLLAELAELEDHHDEAIKNYTRAIDLGNSQPAVARRLVGLLNKKDEFDQIERVIKVLSDRGLAPKELTISFALEAIRRQDYDRGIKLARQVFHPGSTNFADHLFLGQFFLAASRPRDAGQELRRAVELGPAVPVVWVNYVQYLVGDKQLEQAKTVVASARRALPATRASVALAQCYELVGDAKQAEANIQAALRSTTCDLTTIRVAIDLYVKRGHFDQVEPILNKLSDPTLKATPDVLAWADRTRGLALLSTGRLAEMDRALILVERNLTANPTNLDDLRLKAAILGLRSSRRGEAIKLLEPLDGSNKLGADDQFLLAKFYLADRLTDKYRSQMIKILAAGSSDTRHLVHFIDFLIRDQELEQAEFWLEKLKHVAPPSLSRFELEAGLLRAKKLEVELLALLQNYSKDHADDIGSVAVLYERYGYLKQAEQAFRAFSSLKSKEPLRILALVGFLSRQNRDHEAFALCEQAWTTCPPEPAASVSLAVVASGKNLSDDQRRRVDSWLEDALRRQPTSIQIRLKLARLRSIQRRYDQSESLYRDVLSASPNDLEALNNLAWLLAFQHGKEQEALGFIDRAYEFSGSDTTVLDTRAVIYLQLGKPEQALHDLRDALAINPQKSDLYVHLARAQQMSRNKVEARKALRHAEELGIKPDTIDPLENDVFVKLRHELASLDPSS